MDKAVKDIPKYGFKVNLDHKYPERWRQKTRPRLRQLPPLLPLSYRYIKYYAEMVRNGRPLLMDYVKLPTGMQIYGVPIGGIGGGTIGRGFKGEFCRYALLPGLYKYHVMPANQFIATVKDVDGNTVYNQVLSTVKKPKYLKSWKWGFNGKNASYTGLYPRSWTEYRIEELDLKLTCRQISPVIPHNYKDTSLPCAIFVWDIENTSGRDLSVSITFTFQSGCGGKGDRAGDKHAEYFECENTTGVMIHQEFRGMPCTYAISSSSGREFNVTRALSFDPRGDGISLWRELQTNGKLETGTSRTSSKTKNAIGCAVCVNQIVKSGQTGTSEFSLVWDMPKIHFYGKAKEYLRFYTKYFHNTDRSAAPEISHYALTHYEDWESEICRWQSVVLQDPDLPDWYKSALFNELYFVTDGGSVWLRTDDAEQFSSGDPRIEYGRFAYLEGQEYRMYNTYDVHFYAAFALLQLWPNLEACIQYECRDNVHMEDLTRCSMLYDGVKQPRKVKGTVPHDIGDPGEEPFKLINAYPVHDVSEWKDLNTKYILSCYRDYAVGKNLEHLKDFWPTIKDVLQHCLSFDKDNDGLIENAGCPDQTYDSWVMNGPSAYCGGLWLAALHCTVKIAEILGHDEDARKYTEILEKGKVSFQEKLWNGTYYNFDSSKSEHRKCIMSDQLCGQWLLRASGFTHEVFPKDNVNSALKTIYENNVMKFKNGQQGAVNGFLPSGKIDFMTVQSEEMWTGVTYGLAALMIHEDMVEEAFQTAEGVYKTVYEKIGMGFETPEALYEDKFYRAIGYMRPLSIWAMHLAWTSRKNST